MCIIDNSTPKFPIADYVTIGKESADLPSGVLCLLHRNKFGCHSLDYSIFIPLMIK